MILMSGNISPTIWLRKKCIALQFKVRYFHEIKYDTSNKKYLIITTTLNIPIIDIMKNFSISLSGNDPREFKRIWDLIDKVLTRIIPVCHHREQLNNSTDNTNRAISQVLHPSNSRGTLCGEEMIFYPPSSPVAWNCRLSRPAIKTVTAPF